MSRKPRRAHIFTQRFWRRPVVRRALLLSGVYLALSLFLFLCILPESVQLEVGQASPRYGAPRTVETVILRRKHAKRLHKASKTSLNRIECRLV